MNRICPQCALRPIRRGTSTILVVLALFFVIAMIGVMLRQFNLSNQHRRFVNQQAQASLLAESGIERAISRAQQEEKYDGEMWSIPAGELHASSQAEVEIKIDRSATPAIITVTALYPSKSDTPAKVKKRIQTNVLGLK